MPFVNYHISTNPLWQAISEYQSALERGNYSTLDNYSTEVDRDETDEEVGVIQDILTLSKKLCLDENLSSLSTKLAADCPIGFPKIVHLVASLNLLEEQKSVEPTEELIQLENNQTVMVQIEAGMPGPCLAYLGAIRASSRDKRIKLSRIEGIINNIFPNMNKFGILSSIVLRIAVKDWVDIYSKSELEFKERAKERRETYTKYVENSLEVSEVIKKMTTVEKFIIRSCEKLNNGIGQTNLDELSAVISPEIDRVLEVKNPSLNSPKFDGAFFSVVPPVSPALSGELLESFNELVLNELEMLADITDECSRNLLMDILLDPTMSTENIAKYAEAIDPIFGKRFAVVYCCMYPEKWDEPFMQSYKKIIINSYIERSTGKDNSRKDPSLIEKRMQWLKQHGNHLLEQFFEAREIKQVRLNKDETEQKAKKLALIKMVPIDISEIQKDTESLKADKESMEILINTEGETGIFKEISSGSSKGATLFRKDTHYCLSLSAWKELNKYDPRWQSIYELIKVTPHGKHLRLAEKMLPIVQAILYKEEKNCRWPELPQHFPPGSTVRHYYYQWKSARIVDKIKEIMASHNQNVSSVQLK
jgi:Putative transposase of IS4/5 family (DUF4096)